MSQRGKRIIAWACIIGMMVLTLSGSLILFLQNGEAQVQQQVEQPELRFMDGEITAIEKDESLMRVTVKNDEQELLLIVVEKTYIGDATKSPEKPDDFLEVGMKGSFIYAETQGVNLAYSINIVQ